MNRILLLLILICNSIAVILPAQNITTNETKTFAFSVYGGSGFNKQTSQSADSKNDIHPSFNLGIQWKPNHLLYIGIESGFVNIDKKTEENISTDFGKTSFKASLSAIPLVLVYNMRIRHIDVSGGLGISNVSSVMEVFNTKMITNRWFYTYYAAIGYSIPVQRFTFLARANLLSFSKMNKTIAGASLLISYDFLRW